MSPAERPSRAACRPWEGRRAGAALAALLALVPAAAGDPVALPPGRRVDAVLPPAPPGVNGASRMFALAPTEVGPLTVTVESLDGDVLVRLVDREGATLAEDDNSGVEGNARLLIERATVGETLHLLVIMKHPAGGAVTLEALAGDVPQPQGAELAAARGRFLEARGLRRQALGEDRRAASDLGRAGDLLFGTQHYADACEVFAALEQLLEALGDRRHAASARAFQACALSRLQRFTEAVPLLEAAVQETGEAGLGPQQMLALAELGDACRLLGQLARAEARTTQALELARTLGDRGNEALLLVQLARVALARGQSEDALAACEEAGALAAELQAPPLRREVLAVRAEGAVARGNLRGALEHYEEALALPATPWQRARLLGARAEVQWVLGDTLAAARGYREAGDVAARIGDTALQATATLGLGLVQSSLGDPARARDAFEAALEALGDDGSILNRCVALCRLSLAQLELGDRAAARRSSDAARTLAREAGDVAREVLAVATLAEADRLAGNRAGTLARSRECLQLAESGALPREQALALAFVAQAELRSGDAGQATALGLLALERLTALHCHRDALHPLCTLADAAIGRGDAEAAARWLDQAEATLRRVGAATGDAGNLADLRSGDTEHTPGQLAQDLALLRVRQAGADPVRRAAAIDAGLRACGAWKGFALLDGLERQRGGGEDAEAARLLAERQRVWADRDATVAELVAAVAADRPTDETAALRARIEGFDARAAGLGERLARLSPREALFEGARAWGLSEVRGLLGPRDVYIEYAESMDRLYAYVVTTTRESLVDLGPRARRAAEVEIFLAGVTDPAHLAGVAQVAQAGGALHAALLAPLLAAAAPDDTSVETRLLIVPSALLSQLPFEALVREAPAAPASFAELQFVLDRHEVVYAPSGPVLALMEQARPRETPGRALVMGDPEYPPADASVPRGSRDPRSLGFVRLPGTRDEALGVAQRLLDMPTLLIVGAASAMSAPTAPRAAPPAAPAVVLADARAAADIALDTPALRLCLGSEASAEALRGDLREFSLIHCATHGHVDEHDPRLTGLALTPQGEDDGFVTLADVLELSLDADLAVLSACETGRGRERRGEGTQSLARAFLHAGARSVVSSLWQVDDRETEHTMLGFYDALATRGLSASAALREARLAIRSAPASPEAFRGTGRGKRLDAAAAPAPVAPGKPELAGHPYFWAAFTYTGPPDYRPLAPAAK